MCLLQKIYCFSELSSTKKYEHTVIFTITPGCVDCSLSNMNLGKGKKKVHVHIHIWKKILRPVENQLHRKVEPCVELPKASSWNGFEWVQIMISGETPGSQLGTVM